MENSTRSMLFWTGLAGLIGATLVGIGEFTFQFSPNGGYEDSGYTYFVDVSQQRLSFGHFLSTFAAPLYVLGYWHLGHMFIHGGSRVHGWIITLLGSYAFIVGNAWLGGRIYLALTVHEISAASPQEIKILLSNLLSNFGLHNEPLVNALRLAMVVVSLLWIWRIAAGKTLYPKWLAIFSPALILGLIFLSYFLLTDIGVLLLPAAMNIVHIVVFSLSLYALHYRYNE